MNDLILQLAPIAAALLAPIVAYLIGSVRGKQAGRDERDAEAADRDRTTSERIDHALDEDAAARDNGEHWIDRLRRAGQ